MKLGFACRRYRLPFRTTVRTAHGAWPEREGLLVRLHDAAGRTGFGEAAPIPWFGTETVEQAEQAARSLGESVDFSKSSLMAELATNSPCLANALAAARAELDAQSAAREAEPPADGRRDYLALAALLPAGRSALAQIAAKADTGFRVFKWKVGVGDAADEIALLDDVCAALPEGSKLRLDANGAWDRRVAERWLERCAERPIEFVEQPCFAAATESVACRQRTEDLLHGLACDFPTPIALDESLVSDGDVSRWIAAGWRGWYVVKPSLLASPRTTLDRLGAAKAPVVFSSALETAVGARSGLRLAFEWAGEPRALGFGVWPLFADARFDGPSAGPFVYRQDVERINAQKIWEALEPR